MFSTFWVALAHLTDLLASRDFVFFIPLRKCYKLYIEYKGKFVFFRLAATKMYKMSRREIASVQVDKSW